MPILTIVSTNRNLFITIHNNNRLLYRNSLGLLKMNKKDIRISNNLKFIVKDVSNFMKKLNTKWIDLNFRSCSNWKLVRMIFKQIKNHVLFNKVLITAKQPYNGTKVRKKRRI